MGSATLRIALMRASEDAGRSAARLAALGHDAILAPATQIRATGASPPVGPFDVALATSAKALRLLTQEAREAVAELALFVVGDRALGEANGRGLRVRAPAAPDVDALRTRLAAELAPDSRALYLAGRDRKPELETMLANAGHRVVVCEVYAAEPIEGWSADEAEAVANADAALHYSSRGAALALALARRAGVDERFLGLRHVCISAEAAEPLRAAGAKRVERAETPDEAALLRRLGAGA